MSADNVCGGRTFSLSVRLPARFPGRGDLAPGHGERVKEKSSSALQSVFFPRLLSPLFLFSPSSTTFPRRKGTFTIPMENSTGKQKKKGRSEEKVWTKGKEEKTEKGRDRMDPEQKGKENGGRSATAFFPLLFSFSFFLSRLRGSFLSRIPRGEGFPPVSSRRLCGNQGFISPAFSA